VGSSLFDGNIDEIRIWGVTRSGPEISANYAKRLNGSESGLLAYWPIDPTVTDATGNGNDLVATGTPPPEIVTDTPF
jgi:hypothetical protein